MNTGAEEPPHAMAEQSRSAQSHEVNRRGVRAFRVKSRPFWATDRVRLEAVLEAYKTELEQLLTTSSESNRWRESAKRLVDQAQSELRRGKIQAGWACYNAAKRLEVLGLTDDEIRVLGKGVVFEARDKIGNSWRLDTIETIVSRHDSLADSPQDPQSKDHQVATAKSTGPTESTEPTLTGTLLRLAMEVRDESLQNHYWKFHHLRLQLRIIGVVLVLTLATVLPMLAFQSVVLWDPISSNRGALSILACLFGVLGGCLSALRTYTPKSLQVRIPEMYTNSIITILRPLVGGAAGLASFAFLASGAVRFESNIGAVALTIAFVAGFSERLVLSVVESVGGR